MKSVLLAMSLVMSVSVFAQTKTKEFDENTEKKCFAEAKALGCVKADEESQSCLALKKKSLSAACQELLDAKSSD